MGCLIGCKHPLDWVSFAQGRITFWLLTSQTPMITQLAKRIGVSCWESHNDGSVAPGCSAPTKQKAPRFQHFSCHSKLSLRSSGDKEAQQLQKGKVNSGEFLWILIKSVSFLLHRPSTNRKSKRNFWPRCRRLQHLPANDHRNAPGMDRWIDNMAPAWQNRHSSRSKSALRFKNVLNTTGRAKDTHFLGTATAS